MDLPNLSDAKLVEFVQSGGRNDDDKGIQELNKYFKAKRKREEVRLDGDRQDIAERKKYAEYIFILLSIWLLFILMIIFKQPSLSNEVLIALLTTTTLKVIGLFWLVARYLFPRSPEGR
ncbi:MAG: hypothetical protein R2787_14420 [Saprospiraceae bacterium]